MSFNVHMQFSNMGVYTWVKKIHMINAYMNPFLILEANLAFICKKLNISPPPLRCVQIFVMKDEPNAYFKITFAS
jgi:hypothetical protein